MQFARLGIKGIDMAVGSAKYDVPALDRGTAAGGDSPLGVVVVPSDTGLFPVDAIKTGLFRTHKHLLAASGGRYAGR